MKQKFMTLALILVLKNANAVEFEPAGKALSTLLGTTKPFTKKLKDGSKDTTAYYTKNSKGEPETVALIEKGTYPPNCTHTWAVGLEAKTAQIKSIRVVEMSCQHAFPTRAASFMDQFTGKGPAEVAQLDDDIHTISKATGSSKLLIDAVKHSIQFVKANSGKF